MSTATWLKSEPTILLWGDRWWLPQHKLPVPFADLNQAAEVLASVWPYPTRTFRLIYQPDRLATAPVACPNGNRTTLAMALGDEFPALLHPAHVWGHEPILPANERFATLLHFETEPGLFSLVQQLQRHGLTVRTAWPMATWLNALPPEISESGAITVVALHSDRWCIYRHSSSGGRTFQGGGEVDILPAVAAQLQEVAAKAEVEFVLCVTTDDALLTKLEERVALAPNQIIGTHSLWDALAKSAVIPEKHPAQLLPPVPWVTPSRMIGAAAALFIAAALGLAGWQVQQHQTARLAAERKAASTEALRAEVAHLKDNVAEISRLRQTLGEGGGRPAVIELLERLGAAVRPGVALQSIDAAEDGFVLKGGVAAESHDGWTSWRQALSAPDLPWTLASAQPDAAGQFELRGSFRR